MPKQRLATCGWMSAPRSVGRPDPVEPAAPHVEVGPVLEDEKRDGAPVGLPVPHHPVDLGLHGAGRIEPGRPRGTCGDELQHAEVLLRHHREEGRDLGVRRVGARYRLAAHVAVSGGPTGGEAHRTGAQRVAQDLAHRVEVVGGREVVEALPHHVGPDRRVRHLRADVQGAWHPLQRVEVLGERLPLPTDPLGERGARDVLHALHELDEPRLTSRLDRSEAHTAVSEQRGRDAVPARRREVRVPRGLAVEVRVHVDETGRDEQPGGVDRASRLPGDPTDLHDHAVPYCHVGGTGCVTRAVDDGAGTDHEIMHRRGAFPE